ncbi:MAG: ATP-binding cassette domain-containing protein [Acidimicrobiia bacterium]|nr:MAG: ATP-binding cassette domain-containing protein [Acidimicrobiia bacterium]
MALEIRDIHKHFGPVRANDGISFTVEEGSLHGILGENGAGKSTLMKILSGFYGADSGEVFLDGELLHLGSPSDAIGSGIGMLHQDPLVFLPFSVLDNFALGSPGPTHLDRGEIRDELDRVSSDLGFKFDASRLAGSLTIGERQQLAITRLMWLGAKVLIFDEPTTGISAAQRLQLFATLRKLAKTGLIVLFVSHKLEEVEDLCDSVTVIRHGKVVYEAEMPVPPETLVAEMFGKVFVEQDHQAAPLGATMVRFTGATLFEGTTHIEDLNLEVAAAEVIGLGGLEGSGQRALLRACAGLLAPRTGELVIDGADLTGASYRDHLAAGVHYLPAGRLEEGLIHGISITEHLVIASEDKSFLIDWKAAEQTAESEISDYSIKGVPSSHAEALSGGNQQRLLLAMIPDVVRLLLLEHPTRGLDVESAAYVWTRLLARRSDGTSIIFASADLDELLRYSDRIVVFFGGELFAIRSASETDGEELGYLIGGRERV